MLKLNKLLFLTKRFPKKYFATVSPWKVEGKVDYKKLVEQFGTELINDKIIQKFEKITNQKIHPWIKRGLFFSHRGLDTFLDAYEKCEMVFLYTGRGPSTEAMHIGHLVPFLFTKWLQETFDCPLVIQISDEEKAAFKNKKFKEVYKLGFENAKEIISIGFDPEKTFIFSNRDYRLNCKNFELLASEMKGNTNMKEVQKIFGFDESATVLMYDWPFYQSAAAFYQAFPHIFGNSPAHCLVPHAIDQDPYFRLARDLSPKMNLIKPCNIMSKFIPSLAGENGKMSSSENPQFTIFLNDTEQKIVDKILKHSFSGGGGDGSLADHKKYGGNPEIDISFHYLNYFEMDEVKLENIKNSFRNGDLTCSGIKNLLIEKLIPIIKGIQENQQTLFKKGDYFMKQFYEMKPMPSLEKRKEIKFQKNTNYYTPEHFKLFDFLAKNNIKYSIIYHENYEIILQDTESINSYLNSINGQLTITYLLKGVGENYYMYISNSEVVLNLKELKKKLNEKRLMFAEKDTMKYLFNFNENKDFSNNQNFVISPFSLVNYHKKEGLNLIILIESDLKNYEYVNLHTINLNFTTRMLFDDIIKYFQNFDFSLKYI
jgi:tryptophanyl-tRNA synthetase